MPLPDTGEQEITAQTFDSILAHADTPVAVRFFADWSGPCRMIEDSMRQLVSEFSSQMLFTVYDVEQSYDIAGRFGITSIPAVLFFDHGSELSRMIGAHPLENFRHEVLKTLAQHVPPQT